VNFVSDDDGNGTVEARYVRRTEDYFIVYLSSQTGCRQACRFCHLTQTGQTTANDVDLSGFSDQAESVLSHYDQLAYPARMVHFNFMARGEAFANQHLLNHGDDLVDMLSRKAVERGLIPKTKFSTIMPRSTMYEHELTDIFARTNPDIYYSVYSVDESFRRRWLPKAMPVADALQKLLTWQKDTRKIPVLHWAFIEDENDTPQDVIALCETVRESGLLADVNVVRYNPYSPKQGREPSEEVLQRNAQLLRDELPTARVKVVTRVGFDVKASCGMFVGGRER
jgi:23S rRNA (adenine2503-C2)-methyltransferase